jgi:tripartite ATP-independent transporter DctP family solute receptor
MRCAMVPLVVCVVVLAGFAEAGEFTLKLATSQPPKGGYLGGMEKIFADELEKLTKGQVKTRIFHSGSLSSNEAELAQMAQSGAVDASIAATTYILGWAPSMKVFDLPYLFEGAGHFKRVVQGPVGGKLAAQVEDDGVVLVAYILPGIRSIFNTKRPIGSLEDAKGMKIRSMQSPVYVDMFKSFGMLPTPMPSSELYTSLQTGVVDAGENDPASVVSWGWVDVIKFYSLDEHSLTACVLVLNKKRFDSFSPEIQKAIREAGKRAETYQLDYIEKAAVENLEKIKAKGVKVNVIANKKPSRIRSNTLAQYEKEIGPDIVQAVARRSEAVGCGRLRGQGFAPADRLECRRMEIPTMHASQTGRRGCASGSWARAFRVPRARGDRDGLLRASRRDAAPDPGAGTRAGRGPGPNVYFHRTR